MNGSNHPRGGSPWSSHEDSHSGVLSGIFPYIYK